MPCEGPDCDRETKSRGLCHAHYQQRYRYGIPLKPLRPKYEPTCSFEGCGAKHFSLGLCQGHYEQQRAGQELRPISRLGAEARFWEKVDRRGPDGCWIWTGALLNNGGYGHLTQGGENVSAHRYSWELAHGPLPPGARVGHTCDESACVNPAHLQI